MGKQIQQRVERLLGKLGIAGKDDGKLGGFVGIENGRYEYTPDIIRAGIEEQSRFILSVLEYGSPAEHWQMNVYEFYREFVRAYGVNKERKAEIERQKRNRR